MENVDFELCEFIEWNMWFVTYEDFCKKHNQIKRIYKGLSLNQKRFYKWYVYANINMDTHHKNVIWEFLNQDQIEYYMELLRLLVKSKKH